MFEGGALRWPVVDRTGGAAESEPEGSAPEGVAQTELFAADELAGHHVGAGEWAGYEFLHVRARTLINRVPQRSSMPFSHTINVYRGCSHACVYCFARPTHEYLGLDAGTDFERRIVVKINAVELLRAELAGRRWSGEPLAMGTNTDPYQRCEGRYRLTRGVVEVLAEAANPFSILTKSTLVLRDLDLLVAASERTDVRVNLSIGTLDPDVWRSTEPGTPSPAQRVEAVRRLADAGIRTGVLVAPLLPGLSDATQQIREVMEAVTEAGAHWVSAGGLHLRPGVREHWMAWLATARPDLVPSYRRLFARAYLSSADATALASRISEATPTDGRTGLGQGPAPAADRLRAHMGGRHGSRATAASAAVGTVADRQLVLGEL